MVREDNAWLGRTGNMANRKKLSLAESRYMFSTELARNRCIASGEHVCG